MTPDTGAQNSTADRVVKVDHVALAVTSMRAAAHFFTDVLGGTLLSGGDNHTTGIRLVQLMLPGLKIELMQSLRDDSILADHMRRRGPGFHHLTFMVDDVEETVQALADDGYTVVGTNTSLPAWTETFLSPRDTFGALLQFVHTEMRWDVATTDYTLGDILAGDVVWNDYVACVQRPGKAPA